MLKYEGEKGLLIGQIRPLSQFCDVLPTPLPKPFLSPACLSAWTQPHQLGFAAACLIWSPAPSPIPTIQAELTSPLSQDVTTDKI